MAESSWPSPNHNSRAVTDAEYEELAARFSDDGVYGDPTDTAVVSAGTGLQVVVRAGVYASLRGHAWTSGTTDLTLAISANSSGSSRTDVVVLRLDRSTWDVTATVREGTPGSGAPSLPHSDGSTGFYESPLALVTVPDGATSVTVRPYTHYVGARIRPCTSTTHPLWVARGGLVYETDTGKWLGWNGTSVVTVYEDSGQITLTGSVSSWDQGGTESVLQVRSGTACLRLGTYKRVGGGTLDAAAESRLPINVPSAYQHPNRDQYAAVYISGARIGRITVYSASSSRPGQIWLTEHPDMAVGDSLVGTSISWTVD